VVNNLAFANGKESGELDPLGSEKGRSIWFLIIGSHAFAKANNH
jgi:hypothetical protein